MIFYKQAAFKIPACVQIIINQTTCKIMIQPCSSVLSDNQQHNASLIISIETWHSGGQRLRVVKVKSSGLSALLISFAAGHVELCDKTDVTNVIVTHSDTKLPPCNMMVCP